ncbi:MAG: trypsin-like peptidase domain-containing protein [Clostridiaceae bacterium]|nr:trypsin-like peptidase domain-containing protein [Clostridiaceae bacterium]
MEKVNNKNQPDNKTKSVILILVVGLFIGGFIGYLFGYYLFAAEKENTKNQLTSLSGQINEIQVETFNNNENTKNIIEELQGRLSQIQEQIEDLSGEINNSGQNLIETSNEIASLEAQIFSITEQIGTLEDNIENTIQDFYSISNENISLSLLFEQVRESVVVIQGLIPQTPGYVIVQGSGFVYNYSGNMVILTNNHVIVDANSITVTFTNGNSYDATILGSDPNNDFAILALDAPQEIYKPLEIISSSTLKVGHSVIVVGTPYGLEGSLSNGIVSALNRTISIDEIIITNVIQTTTPLNPGNSGGPLMNYDGQVIGISTAIVEESQGIGFAIPSDTILTDIEIVIG